MSAEAFNEEPPGAPPDGTNGLTSRTAGALAVLALLVFVPYLVPSLWRFRVLTPLPDGVGVLARPTATPVASVPVGEVQLTIETRDQDELQKAAPLTTAVEPKDSRAPISEKKPPRSIEDPSGSALVPFFSALASAEKKDADGIARVTYFGDSIVASDFVTGTLRRKLQERFGDSGHGFVLMASPWPGYSHNDVARFATSGWQVSRVVGPFARDGLYGLGGVSFRSEGPGLLSRFGTATKGNFGRRVGKFVLDYLEQPGGGRMDIRVDGALRESLDTGGATVKSAIRTYDVPDGPHELEVRVASANVRVFGVWMERTTPGVVLDAIGIQGCRIRFLDQTDDTHFAEQLRLRNPSLTVFQYGMNESEDGELFPLDQYESTMKAVLVQVKAALPNSSCLLVGPLDRSEKRGDGFRSRPVIPKLAAIQRKVAFDVGCAYWDTLSAMGGFGSMAVWYQRGLGGADLAHPSSAGAEVLGNWIYLALMEAYEAYKRR